MICINHLRECDLIAATKSKPVGLKKGAVPNIFDQYNQEKDDFERTESDENKSVRSSPTTCPNINPIESNESNEQCALIASAAQTNDSSEIRKILQAENEELRKEYSIEQINNNMKVQNLQNEIVKLRATVAIQSDHIKRLNQQAARTLKTKESLQKTVDDLKLQNLITKDATDIIEVRHFDSIINFPYIFQFLIECFYFGDFGLLFTGCNWCCAINSDNTFKCRFIRPADFKITFNNGSLFCGALLKSERITKKFIENRSNSVINFRSNSVIFYSFTEHQ